MRAVVFDRYGPPDVLRLEDVERPVPKDDEVLVKVHATTVNRLDCATREANRRSGLALSFMSRLVFGLRRPKQRVLGTEFAGEVEAVGAAVREFAVGDKVFGTSGLSFGAHAEFVCMRESARIAHMPAGMTFGEAAPVCDGALNALTCLKQADLRKGRRILIYGASGAIGTAGVQLARYFGADVTAVCNTKNLELVKSLGADRVSDYTQEDFTRNGQTYDVIVDTDGVLFVTSTMPGDQQVHQPFRYRVGRTSLAIVVVLIPVSVAAAFIVARLVLSQLGAQEGIVNQLSSIAAVGSHLLVFTVAVGIVTMAILEAVKRLLPMRGYFHRQQIGYLLGITALDAIAFLLRPSPAALGFAAPKSNTSDATVAPSDPWQSASAPALSWFDVPVEQLAAQLGTLAQQELDLSSTGR